MVFCVSLLALPGAQAQQAAGQQAAGQNHSVLDRRFKAAQGFQAANELDKAAQQYRIFIADSLGQIAIGRVHAGEYNKAAAEFDEALQLVPDFPALELEYAHAALDNNNADHARLLVSHVLAAKGLDPKLAARAHALEGRVLLKLGKNAEAKGEIEQAVALDPTFENGYELAVADLDLGDGDAAAKIFAEMLASFGDTAQIHMLFGQAYGGSDFQMKALEEFRTALAKDDRLPGAHYSLASAYLSTAGNSKLPEIEAELRREIAVSPDNASAYAALGHLIANDNKAEALKDLKRATELDPQSPDAFLYLGQMEADAGQTAEAETALRRSVALTTDVSRNAYQVRKAHYLLGRLLMQDGKTEEGGQELATSRSLLAENLSKDQDRLSDYLQTNKAAGMGGAAEEVHAMGATERDPEAARLTDGFEKQVGPAIADSYNNLGAIAGGESQYRQALGYFKRAAEWNPSLPGLDFNWGRAAFAAGAPAEAVGPLSSYVRAHPTDDGARSVLGLSQFLSKDYAGARKTLETIADKAGENGQIEYAYAESLVETNDLPNGVARLVALEKADPNIADVHRSLGEAYVKEHAPNAADELGAAIRLNPRDAEAHAALGRLQSSEGKTQEAMLHLQRAAELDPGNAAVRDDLARLKGMAQ